MIEDEGAHLMILQDSLSWGFKAFKSLVQWYVVWRSRKIQIKEDSDKKGQSQCIAASMWAASLLRGLRPFPVFSVKTTPVRWERGSEQLCSAPTCAFPRNDLACRTLSLSSWRAARGPSALNRYKDILIWWRSPNMFPNFFILFCMKKSDDQLVVPQ